MHGFIGSLSNHKHFIESLIVACHSNRVNLTCQNTWDTCPSNRFGHAHIAYHYKRIHACQIIWACSSKGIVSGIRACPYRTSSLVLHVLESRSKDVSHYTAACHYNRVMVQKGNATLSASLRY